MITEKNIRKLVEDAIKGSDMFLVEVKVKLDNKIYVFVDGDSGVKISDCAEISRFITAQLDRDVEDFDLNVSSSGLDHPFRMNRQYRKNIGKKISVMRQDGEKLAGTLLEVDDEGIVIQPEKGKKKKNEPELENIHLLFNEIKETKCVVSFK